MSDHRCVPIGAKSGDGGGFGAYDRCTETEGGELWIDNGEYATQVNYCPVCGLKARRQFNDDLRPHIPKRELDHTKVVYNHEIRVGDEMLMPDHKTWLTVTEVWPVEEGRIFMHLSGDGLAHLDKDDMVPIRRRPKENAS